MPVVVRIFRRPTHDNIEVRREFTGVRILDRREVHQHRLALLLVADGAEQAIARVEFVATHVALRRKQVFFAFGDFVVNVRCSAGVRLGLDRTELVVAFAVGPLGKPFG